MDVEGLRTVAALLVASYHIWTDRISGAVDVFFVVSAFVLTQAMLRALGRNESLRLLPAYKALLFRMAPLAWAVVAGTMIAGLVLMPVTEWATIAKQAGSAGTFTINYLLADESVAYLGDESASSLFQHFWAMAVQVQFGLVLPLLGVLAVFVARVWRRPATVVLATVFGVVLVLSFAWAIVSVSDQQTFAYYDTAARAWEFAAGGIAAIVANRFVLPRSVSVIAVAAGLITLITFGAMFDATRLSPGAVSLIPVSAALLILIGGVGGAGIGVSRWLSARPLVAAAGYSFGFYLWHWPVLVIAREMNDSRDIGLVAGFGVMAVAAGLAFVTQRWVSDPVRRMSRLAPGVGNRRAPVLVLAAIAVVPVLAIGGTRIYIDAVLGAQPTTNPGAAVLVEPDMRLSPLAQAQPPLATLVDGQSEEWLQECQDRSTFAGAEFRTCVAGDASAPLNVVALGDSHTEHWLTALRPLVESGELRLTSHFRGGCPLSTVGDDKFADVPEHVEACAQINEERLRLVVDEMPDLVLTTTNIAVPGSPEFWVPDGFVEATQRLTSAGVPVVGLRDVPRHASAPADCLAASAFDEDACAVPQEAVLAPVTFSEAVPDALIDDPLVQTLDMTDLLCFGGWCPAVIGGVIPYIDEHHLTRDYVTTMSPYLLERLSAALDRIPTPASLTL